MGDFGTRSRSSPSKALLSSLRPVNLLRSHGPLAARLFCSPPCLSCLPPCLSCLPPCLSCLPPCLSCLPYPLVCRVCPLVCFFVAHKKGDDYFQDSLFTGGLQGQVLGRKAGAWGPRAERGPSAVRWDHGHDNTGERERRATPEDDDSSPVDVCTE